MCGVCGVPLSNRFLLFHSVKMLPIIISHCVYQSWWEYCWATVTRSSSWLPVIIITIIKNVNENLIHASIWYVCWCDPLFGLLFPKNPNKNSVARQVDLVGVVVGCCCCTHLLIQFVCNSLPFEHNKRITLESGCATCSLTIYIERKMKMKFKKRRTSTATSKISEPNNCKSITNERKTSTEMNETRIERMKKKIKKNPINFNLAFINIY